jgi:hypothetical protein
MYVCMYGLRVCGIPLGCKFGQYTALCTLFTCIYMYIRNTHVGLVEDSHMTWATPEREGNTNTVILESSAGTIPPPTDTASWCGIQYMTKQYFTRLWHP